MKRLISVLLFLSLLVGALSLPASAADTASGKWGNLDWTLDENGTLTISGQGNMKDFVELRGSNSNYWLAAWHQTDSNLPASIKKVVISEGVTSIGNDAFAGCTSLAEITIPDSVTYIGMAAFESTAYYKDDSNWTGNVLYIGNHFIAAKDDLAGSYTIRQGTITVAGSAFSDCSELTEINIPDSVASIGACAFSRTALTEVNIPDSVNVVGWGAFSGCTEIKNINLPDSITEIGDTAFSGCSSLTEIDIPDSVTSFGGEGLEFYDGVFYKCTSLKSVTIGKNVTGFGSYAFYGCTSLAEITIPESVTGISYTAFENCSALKLVFIKSSDIAAGLVSSDSAGSLVNYAETVILGSKCTATNYIKRAFPYTGTATIGGETCTWYRKTEECAAHYYENAFDADCNICGEKREISAVFGDLNGDGVVDNADAALALRYDAGLTSLKDAQYTAADVNGDEIVDNADAALMLRLDAGLINKF